MTKETRFERRERVKILVRCLRNGIHGTNDLAVRKDMRDTLNIHLATARRWMLQAESKYRNEVLESGTPHGGHLKQIDAWIDLLIEAHDLTPTGMLRRGVTKLPDPDSSDHQGDQLSLGGVDTASGRPAAVRKRAAGKAPGRREPLAKIDPQVGERYPMSQTLTMVRALMGTLSFRELGEVISHATDLIIERTR